jgi:hypothetical protein
MQYEKEIVVYKFLLEALQKRFEFFGVPNLTKDGKKAKLPHVALAIHFDGFDFFTGKSALAAPHRQVT